MRPQIFPAQGQTLGGPAPGARVPAVQVPAQPRFFRPVPIDQDQFSTLGFMVATLTIASAATIGSNMVDVGNGTMTRTQAVVNGLVKGTAATLVLSVTPKKTVFDVALTAAALAGTGYVIDKAMKRNREEICQVQTEAPDPL